MNNIYLIGMMGSGKSVVARLLAERLHRPMVDLDQCIVDTEGRSIHDIFMTKGEAYFRAVEKKILKCVAAQKEQVVATGGGIVLDEDNMNCMRKTGVMIYLKASTDILYARLKNKTDRPLLRGKSPRDKLDSIYHHRAGLYAKADYAVDTAGKVPDEVTREIVQLLEIEGLI